MTNEYKKFSYFYDELTEEMDYQEWIDFTIKYAQNNSKILDCACGSGNLLITLNKLGYDTSGLDISYEMLDIARKKINMNHLDIKLHECDMTKFNLNESFDIITCYFDSLNHLSNEEDILKMLECSYNHLNKNGYLLVDLFTKEKMEDIDNEEFIYDEPTYKANWKVTADDNQINHEIKITLGNETTTEYYTETYFDIKKIIPNSFTLVEEYDVILDDVCERQLFALRKNNS